ncbi:MAG TPA: DUF1800 domain-containing protein [Bryobacteraceae bacterium]|nr:DUF1800 domain-containing protein [Bryobacteraceae bacterium]
MIARTLTAVLLSASLAIPAPAPAFQKRIAKDKEALHALDRLTFGAGPGDLDTVRRIGVKKWIDQQLEPEKIAENPILEARLKPLTTLTMSQSELASEYPPAQLIRAYAAGRLPLPADPGRRAAVERLIERYKQRRAKADAETTPDRDETKPKITTQLLAATGPRRFNNAPVEQRRAMLATNAPQQVVVHDLLEQKVYRAVYSNRQLAEVLTDFWFNHFNVFLDKGADRYLVTSYERDAIRPNVLGKFHHMLKASAQHPAMLFYLDNWQSVAPNAPKARARRARGLNENYARELLELHTLGVEGGYTQQDIVELARCFTGWTIAEPFRSAAFVFNPRVHDNGEKNVLGVRIPAGGGQSDGFKVLEILSRHPSTARFVSTKLAQRFVADAPPESLVKAMSATFQKTDGDLKAVLRTMLESREFWSEAAYRSKVKSPLEMVASSIRAVDANVTLAYGLATRIADLGQPLYRKQEPTGYANTSKEWVNSAALLGRMNFALDLVQNKLPGVKVDPGRFGDDPATVDKRILFYDASPETRAAIARGIAAKKQPAVIAALVLGSPEFQRR